MSISDALGEPRAVVTPAGAIDYRERGDGPPMVFVHGVGSAATCGGRWSRR